MQAIFIVTNDLLDQIKNSWSRDEKLQKIIHSLQKGHNHSHYSWSQGQLLWKGKLVIGQDAALRTQLLKLFHDSVIGGYSRLHATYQRLATISF